MRTRACGFSLAEVVVALGILAGVLLSIGGLLVLGTRQVGAGRARTSALAVARDVLEQMGGWGFGETYTTFSCDPALATCLVQTSVSGAAPAVEWQTRLDQTLAGARAEILLEALDATSLGAASAIRVHVKVFWRDTSRDRELSLATVRS